MPRPSAPILRLISRPASSSSSRASVLACSATSFAAGPTPWRSVSRVGMSPPVEELRDGDAGGQRDSHHEERVRAVPLRALAVLLPARGHDVLSGFEVFRRLSFRA